VILYPYFIALATGLCLTHRILRGSRAAKGYVRCILALGLGLGICSQISFYTQLACQGWDMCSTTLLHLLAMFLPLGCYFFFVRQPSTDTKTTVRGFIGSKKELLALLAMCLYLVPMVFYCLMRPSGDWDAHSVWNQSAKYILFTGNPLDTTLTNNHPPLLPFLTVWGWNLSQQHDWIMPATYSILFTVATAMVIFLFLNQYTKTIVAFFASLSFLSTPFVIWHSVSQYAEPEFAFYLIAVCACFFIAIEEEDRHWGFLGGLFLGLFSFTKREANITTFLFLLLLFLVFRNKMAKETSTRKIVLFFLIGFSCTFLASLVFKSLPSTSLAERQFDLDASNDVESKQLNQMMTFLGIHEFGAFFKNFTSDRIITVERFAFKTLSNKDWIFIWPLLAAGWLVCIKRALHNKTILLFLLFVLSYFSIYFSFTILQTWEIEKFMFETLSRTLFEMLPVALCLFFLMVFPEKGTQSQQHNKNKDVHDNA